MDPMVVVELVGLAALATGNVSLWTFRVALAAGGRRAAAACVAGIEALVFVLVFGSVVSALDDPFRVVAYAVGVGLGTLVGIVADERLAGGQSLVNVVIDGEATTIQGRLHERGWPFITTPGVGVRGEVTVLTVAVDDRVLPRLVRDLEVDAADGFVTIERLRQVRPVALPAPMHAVGAGRRRRR